jgi:hypothetical protein
MRHPFRNNAPHIKLSGESFVNCQTYFGQPENDDHRVLSGYASSCVSFIHDFNSATPLFSITSTLAVIGEQRSYAAEITNGRYMRASVTRKHMAVAILGWV